MLALYASVVGSFGAAFSRYRPMHGALLGAAIGAAIWFASHSHVVAIYR